MLGVPKHSSMKQAAAAKLQERLRKLATPVVLDFGTHDTLAFIHKMVWLLMLLLSIPTANMFFVLLNPSTRYWMGRWPLLVAMATLAWCVVGQRVAFKGHISRAVYIELLIVPVLTFAVLSFICHKQAFRTFVELRTESCAAFPSKHRVELAWMEANDLLTRCINEQVAITGSPIAEVEQVMVVQRCHGYEELRKDWAPEWNYLETLETEHRCSGWCTKQRLLWTVPYPNTNLQDGIDKCSLVAAGTLEKSVHRISLQSAVYCSAVIFVLATIIPFLETF
eukprot:TRINITY_DN45717_c0_g1_i1.p1 TRINITY_DN45717_c0_g1~~TRINITY_DN45717_c0_g1_i1.p1  ORF type:complete len:280 (-),score=27.31 TRINITY_DN45717_c0_g1_i1:6-845(-)